MNAITIPTTKPPTICDNAMKTAAIILTTLLLSSCTIESITIRGKFGDYIFKPRRPIIIEEASK